ncbi:hypothetical protein [Pajaroellobacter abortibovis]|nr:hypothetical protein [Pajaroellobacter abortibovis]
MESNETNQRKKGWWCFLVLLLVGLMELGLHFYQRQDVVSEQDWQNVRTLVASWIQQEDWLTFSPDWIEPVGRAQMGNALATVERIAAPDETRFPRAIELSIRNHNRPELRSWKKVKEKRLGRITVRLFENPTPVSILSDLVQEAKKGALLVSRVQSEHLASCPQVFQQVQTGGFTFGPAIAAQRWVCPGGSLVTVTVVPILDYRPRQCIYLFHLQEGASVRLIFPRILFGRALHGHHGLYANAEHEQKGAPVKLSFSIGQSIVGQVTHYDGDGWKGFEFDTQTWAADRAELTVDIVSSINRDRMYCFEADTR